MLVRADKAVQSNSASWSNEDAPESAQSFTFDPDVQGGSGGTFLLDRKRVEQSGQTEAVTKGVGNSESVFLGYQSLFPVKVTGFLSGLMRGSKGSSRKIQ